MKLIANTLEILHHCIGPFYVKLVSDSRLTTKKYLNLHTPRAYFTNMDYRVSRRGHRELVFISSITTWSKILKDGGNGKWLEIKLLVVYCFGRYFTLMYYQWIYRNVVWYQCASMLILISNIIRITKYVQKSWWFILRWWPTEQIYRHQCRRIWKR